MYGTSLLYLVSIKTNFSIRWIEFLSIKINRVFFRSFLLDYSAACIFSGTRQLNYFCWILQIYRMWCPPAYKVHWLMFLGHHNYLFISTKQALPTTTLLRNENGLNFRRFFLMLLLILLMVCCLLASISTEILLHSSNCFEAWKIIWAHFKVRSMENDHNAPFLEDIVITRTVYIQHLYFSMEFGKNDPEFSLENLLMLIDFRCQNFSRLNLLNF